MNISRISIRRVELFDRMGNFIELRHELRHLIVLAVVGRRCAHAEIEVQL